MLSGKNRSREARKAPAYWAYQKTIVRQRAVKIMHSCDRMQHERQRARDKKWHADSRLRYCVSMNH